MNYLLGIDVGTSYTAAATWRLDGQQHTKAEVVPLGSRAAAVASMLFLGADGSVVVGEAAERRALTDPDRVVREFKRRIGDETPLFVGGQPYTAHDLAAMVVRWVIERVTEREGGPPDRIAITHPASWGPYKRALLRTALGALGLVDLTLLAEPEAAAVSYAAQERVEPSSTIAVYDLGGGTFDAAVVRKTGSGAFTLLGSADGLEQLGGADFDEAVFAHVQAALGDQWDALDVEDPSTLSGLAALRRECIEAKEALSSDTEVSIAVLLPGITSQVRLVRSEFEEMIRPAIEDTVDSLSRAVSSAGLTSADLAAVLLVGGSSRVPLVAQAVSARLGRPVVADADPKATIALGAALSMAPLSMVARRDLANATTIAPVAPAQPVPAALPAPATQPVAAVPRVDGPTPDLAAWRGAMPTGVDAPAPGDTLRQAGAATLEFGTAPQTAPNRPPVVPAARQFTDNREYTGNRTEHPQDRTPHFTATIRSPRRKLIGGALFSVIVTSLVAGAVLLGSTLVPHLSTFASLLRGAPLGSTDSPGATTAPGGGDRDKASTAGSLGNSRGRANAAVPALEPVPAPAEQPAPAEEQDRTGISPAAPSPSPLAPPSSATRTSPSRSAESSPQPQPEPTLSPTESRPEPTPTPSAEPTPSPTPTPEEPPSEPPTSNQPPSSEPPSSQPQPPPNQPPSGTPSTGSPTSATPPSLTPPMGPNG